MAEGLLLDTHVFLWWQTDHHQLSPAVRSRIMDERRVFLSAASVWEVTIKSALGKLVLPEPLSQSLVAHGFQPLSMTCAHGERAGRLPLHHRDPFDRMLIAQAQEDGLVLVTHDECFRAYDVNILWT